MPMRALLVVLTALAPGSCSSFLTSNRPRPRNLRMMATEPPPSQGAPLSSGQLAALRDALWNVELYAGLGAIEGPTTDGLEAARTEFPVLRECSDATLTSALKTMPQVDYRDVAIKAKKKQSSSGSSGGASVSGDPMTLSTASAAPLALVLLLAAAYFASGVNSSSLCESGLGNKVACEEKAMRSAGTVPAMESPLARYQRDFVESSQKRFDDVYTKK